MRRLVDRVMDYREQQTDKLLADPSLDVGNITFVNFTMVEVKYPCRYQYR